MACRQREQPLPKASYGLGLWNVATARKVATLTDQGGGMNSVAFSLHRQTLAAGDDHG